MKCSVLLSFHLDSLLVSFGFYGPVNTIGVMSGRSGNLLIIPYKHSEFQDPTVAQIIFEISC